MLRALGSIRSVPVGWCSAAQVLHAAGTTTSKRRWALVLVVALSACSHAVPAAPVAVFHSLGAHQCEAGGVTPDELAERLRAAGVDVLGVSCGNDGRMRPAMCGAPDGRLAVFDIAPGQRDTALAQGFRLWSDLPQGRRQPCRGR
jgi:hypothetical protein